MGRILGTIAFLCTILVTGAKAQQSPADLILINGKIFTSKADRPYVQALAIKGDRIVAVGTNETIRQMAANGTKIIDLGGSTVIPGINDAHYHLSIAPRSRIDADFKSFDPSWEEAKKVLVGGWPGIGSG